jgi:hypothetical protein
LIGLVVSVVALEQLYRRFLRQPVLDWGATAAEAALRLPGDEPLEQAEIVATRAMTIDAPPSAVWSWLVQMGRVGAAATRTTGSRTCSA